MRSYFVSLTLLIAFFSSTGQAQVYQQPTPAPYVTAALASWRATGEPIYYAGNFYYPSGPTEYFDGRIMARTGTVDAVPVYENSTLEPWSVVLVPIGGNLMQPYERRRSGPLAGTVGSRMPGQPIQRDVELSARIDSARGGELDGLPVAPSGRAQWIWPSPPLPAVESTAALAEVSARTNRASSIPVIRTVPQRETTNAGAYLQFAGAVYYLSGKPVPNDPQRFAKIGDLGGAAVLREDGGSEKTVYVQVVPDGPLAPYTRR